LADVPAEWKNNPQGYAIYLAESAKASQAAQQSNVQAAQAQQQFQNAQNQTVRQNQIVQKDRQAQQSQAGPSQRYLDIQKQYAQQKTASIGSSGTMYKTQSGEYQYVSGAQAGQTFQVNVQQPLSVRQQGQSQSQFAQERATQQVMGNFLGAMERGRAAGRVAPIERAPQGIAGGFLQTMSKAKESAMYKEYASSSLPIKRGIATLAGMGAEAAKILVKPQEELVPVQDPFRVSFQKTGIKAPFFGEVAVPVAEGNFFLNVPLASKATNPVIGAASFLLEPKETLSTTKFRKEQAQIQSRQEASALEQQRIAAEASQQGWINKEGTMITTPDTAEGKAFAARVNKAAMQSISAGAASEGLFAAGEKYNIIKKVKSPQGDTFLYNAENRKTDYEFMMGKANPAGAAMIESAAPGTSGRLALFRKVTETSATLAPTSPIMLSGSFFAGNVEEVVRKPATAAQSLALGVAFGGVTKGIGVAGEAAGFVGKAPGVRGAAARWVPKAAGVLMGGMYAADIGMRVSQEPSVGSKASRLGAITSTEIIPMGIGFGVGYKAVELGAPKVKAGYDLIRGVKGEQDLLGGIKSVATKVKTTGINIASESRIKAAESRVIGTSDVVQLIDSPREVTIRHGGYVRQYTPSEVPLRKPTIEVKWRETGGLFGERIGETVYLGRKLKPGEIPSNALVHITPFGEQTRAGGVRASMRASQYVPTYEFIPEEPKARLFYDRPAEKVSPTNRIRTMSDVASSADMARRTTPILNIQAGTFEYRGISPVKGKYAELIHIYQKLPKAESPKATAFESNMGNPRWDARSQGQSDILSYRAQTDWLIGEPVKQVKVSRVSPLERGGGTTPKQTRPLTGAEALEVTRGERQALQQIKMKPFEFKLQAKSEATALIKEMKAQDQMVRQQPQTAVALQVEQAIMPSYMLERSVGKATKPELQKTMGRQDFGFGRRKRVRLIEEPSSDYGALAMQYQFEKEPQRLESSVTKLRMPASTLIESGMLIGSTKGMQQAQKSKVVQQVGTRSSEVMRQTSKSAQAQYDIIGVKVKSDVSNKRDTIIGSAQGILGKQDVVPRSRQDVIPRQDIIQTREVVPKQEKTQWQDTWHPPPPETPKPPQLMMRQMSAAGPQPKPQFGGWPSEGGAYSFPRQHGLFAFEEKLALITPGQMLSGMYGSKRKRALRKQIW